MAELLPLAAELRFSRLDLHCPQKTKAAPPARRYAASDEPTMPKRSVTRSIALQKGRRGTGTFSALPHAITNSHEYATLSPRAVKLLVDMLAQFRGNNNGDLAACPALLKPRGWRSNSGLQRATQELLAKGFLLQTRLGSRNRAALYAITWLAVDECRGKLEVRAGGPTNLWRSENELRREQFLLVSARKKSSPPTGNTSPRAGQSAVDCDAAFPAGG